LNAIVFIISSRNLLKNTMIMNRKKGILLLSILFTTGIVYSMQNGALNMTGAPGELNCTACHSQTLVNSDPAGQLTISVPGSNGFYAPGATYTVVVQLNYTGRPRFGFAVAARRAGTEFVSVGTFSGSPALGLQITDYVTHTLATIQGNGSKEWRFDWTAPTTSVGKITLYVAGVAANGDAEATGDRVYTQSVDLFPAATSVKKESLKQISSVYPNPVTDKLFIKLGFEAETVVILELCNLNGAVVRQETVQAVKGLPLTFNLTAVQPGAYLLRVSVGQQQATHRVLVY